MESWFERLSPVDATFLYVENADAHMHVGGVLLFEGRAPALTELVEHVASRLDRIPHFRQRLAFVPLQLGRPVWVDHAAFRVESHLRHVTLPDSDPGALRQHAARTFSEPLPLDRPLWHIDLVEGLADGRFALVTRTHHCLLDGIAFNEFLAAITDLDPSITTPAPKLPWTPRRAPGPAELAVASWRESLRQRRLALGAAISATRELPKRLRDSFREARALADLARKGAAPESSLNRPIGPRRDCDFFSLELAVVKDLRATLGATVNDVLLAVVAGALRRFLEARGEILRADLRAFVPVNVRPGDRSAAPGNHIGAIHCPLPVTERDPVERVRKVTRSMRALKEAGEGDATSSLLRLAELSWPALVAQAARQEEAFRRFNLVVSNVPGSPRPQYLLGRRLRQFHPYIPLGSHQTLSIGFHSYAGGVGVGLLADADRMADLSLLSGALQDSLAELVDAVRPGSVAGGDAARATGDAADATARPRHQPGR